MILVQNRGCDKIRTSLDGRGNLFSVTRGEWMPGHITRTSEIRWIWIMDPIPIFQSDLKCQMQKLTAETKKGGSKRRSMMTKTSFFLALWATLFVSLTSAFAPLRASTSRSRGGVLRMSAAERTYIMVRHRSLI